MADDKKNIPDVASPTEAPAPTVENVAVPEQPAPEPALTDAETVMLEQEGHAALFEMGDAVPDPADTVTLAEVEEPAAPEVPKAEKEQAQPPDPGKDNPAPAHSGKVVDFAAARDEAAKEEKKAVKQKPPTEKDKAAKPGRGRPSKDGKTAPDKAKPSKPRDKKSQSKPTPEKSAADKGGAPAGAEVTPEPSAPRDATRAEKEEIVYLNLSDLHPFVEAWIELVLARTDDSIEMCQRKVVILHAVLIATTLCRINRVAILRSCYITFLCSLADCPARTLESDLCKKSMGIALCNVLGSIAVLTSPRQIVYSLLKVSDKSVHYHITVGLARVDVREVVLCRFCLERHVTPVAYKLVVEHGSESESLTLILEELLLGLVGCLSIYTAESGDDIVAILDALIEVIPCVTRLCERSVVVGIIVVQVASLTFCLGITLAISICKLYI